MKFTNPQFFPLFADSNSPAATVSLDDEHVRVATEGPSDEREGQAEEDEDEEA